jgi:isopentenyl diphosphate isomerase/L-lactate dehydrogenase-like FMN-dependent dehydrogenase
MLAVMKADIDVALGLTGCTSIAAVDRTALHPPGVGAEQAVR